MPNLRREYRGDLRVLVGKQGVDPEQFNNQVEEVMSRGAGGRITETEAEIYAIEALSALRDIAISSSPAR